MTLIYFLQGFLYGIYVITMGLIDTVFLYGEIAADKEMFLNEDNLHEVMEEMDRIYDE